MKEEVKDKEGRSESEEEIKMKYKNEIETGAHLSGGRLESFEVSGFLFKVEIP